MQASCDLKDKRQIYDDIFQVAQNEFLLRMIASHRFEEKKWPRKSKKEEVTNKKK